MPRSDYILCSLRPIPCDSERQRAFIILYIPTNQDTSFLTLSTHLQEYDLLLSLILL